MSDKWNKTAKQTIDSDIKQWHDYLTAFITACDRHTEHLE